MNTIILDYVSNANQALSIQFEYIISEIPSSSWSLDRFYRKDCVSRVEMAITDKVDYESMTTENSENILGQVVLGSYRNKNYIGSGKAKVC